MVRRAGNAGGPKSQPSAARLPRIFSAEGPRWARQLAPYECPIRDELESAGIRIRLAIESLQKAEINLLEDELS